MCSRDPFYLPWVGWRHCGYESREMALAEYSSRAKRHMVDWDQKVLSAG